MKCYVVCAITTWNFDDVLIKTLYFLLYYIIYVGMSIIILWFSELYKVNFIILVSFELLT